MPDDTVIIPEFKPRNDAVVVQRLEVEWQGLARPETVRTQYQLYSLVVAVGPDVKDGLKAGDRIMGLFAGAVPLHNTLPYYAMSQDVVLVVVEGGEALVATKPKAPSQLVIPANGPTLTCLDGGRPTKPRGQ